MFHMIGHIVKHEWKGWKKYQFYVLLYFKDSEATKYEKHKKNSENIAWMLCILWLKFMYLKGQDY